MNHKPTSPMFKKKLEEQYKLEFEALSTVPLPYLVNPIVEERLYNIASSIKYNANLEKKRKGILELLKPLGFIKFHAGTNRIAFRHVNHTDIILKVAIDESGMKNVFEEIEAQKYIKPYCTKVFDASPSGVIGLFERVVPIRSKSEFAYVWENVFDTIVDKLIGRVVLDDFGSNYFMNWGIRENFGPVLLDFPYAYPVDENKLYCIRPDPRKYGLPCGGAIDYDVGFNKLYCTLCGASYNAKDLRDTRTYLNIVKENNIDMKIAIKKNGEIIYESPEDVPVCNVLPSSNNNYKGKKKNIPVGDKLGVVVKPRNCRNKNMISEERKDYAKSLKAAKGLEKIMEKYANDIERERQQIEAIKQQALGVNQDTSESTPTKDNKLSDSLSEIMQRTKAAMAGISSAQQQSVSVNNTTNTIKENEKPNINNYSVYSYSLKEEQSDTSSNDKTNQVTIQDNVPDNVNNKPYNPIKIIDSSAKIIEEENIKPSKSINNLKDKLEDVLIDYENNDSNNSRPAKKQKSKQKNKIADNNQKKQTPLPTIDIPKEEKAPLEIKMENKQPQKPAVIVMDPNNTKDLEINFLYNKSILRYNAGSED